MLVESVGDKGKYFGKGLPPVGPGVSSVSYPKLMGDLFFAHGNMNQGVAFKQKIVIAAVDVPADLIFLIVGHVFNQLKSTVLLVVSFQLFFVPGYPDPFFPYLVPFVPGSGDRNWHSGDRPMRRVPDGEGHT